MIKLLKSDLTKIVILLLLSIVSFAQQGEQIIARHIKAIGGENKWQNIDRIKYKTITTTLGLQTISQKYFERNKYYRNDLQLEGRNISDPSKLYSIIISKNKGWKNLPDQKKQGFQPMDSLECKYFLTFNELDNPFLGRLIHMQKITYFDTESFNEKTYHKFLIEHLNGIREFCYLDTETNMLFMRVTLDSENEQTRIYTEYQTTKDGLVVPKLMETAEGMVEITNLEINPMFNEDMFKLPKATK